MFWGKHMLQLTHYCHISIPYHLHTFCGLILLMLSLRSGVSTIRSRDQSPPGRDFSLGPVDNLTECIDFERLKFYSFSYWWRFSPPTTTPMVILWVTFVNIKIQPLLISLPGHSVKYLEIQHFKPRVSLEDIKRFFNASKVRSFLTCKRLLCKFPLHKKIRYWIRSRVTQNTKWATSVKKNSLQTVGTWNAH